MSKQASLFFNEYPHENGNKVLIIHGLLGSSDNWRSIAKIMSKKFHVICLDCRNHGKSFHHPDMSYTQMAKDCIHLIKEKNLDPIHIIGHSMGGKITMRALQIEPHLFKKAIIVDIAPKDYNHHHQHVLKAIQNTPIDTLKSRTEIDLHLQNFLSDDIATRQLLLKNITRDTQSATFHWKCNVTAITKNYPEIMKKGIDSTLISTPTLCIYGDLSSYVQAPDKNLFESIFSSIEFSKIQDAGHWVQAQKPYLFLKTCMNFLGDDLQ